MDQSNRRGVKARIFDTIQIGKENDLVSRIFDYFIVAVIILNISVMFLQTFEELAAFMPLMYGIEVVTILIFCVEYILRIWTADLLYPEKSYPKAIGKFLISYDGIVDLLTILPFFFLTGFVVFRMLRVVRIFHLFRINTRVDSFNVIKEVIYEKRNQIASSVLIIFILMMASSIGMYSAEHEAQPEAFQNAFSGIWWAVSAILTVGYGDIYPITVAGKIMAIITAFLGVGVVAIPTGIISAGFVEQYSKIKKISSIGAGGDIHFVTVQITRLHNWKGKTVEEAELPKGLSISTIIRKDKVILPLPEEKIKEHDRVVLYVNHKEASEDEEIDVEIR